MRRFFAIALVLSLWFGIAGPASASLAGDNVSGLTPCGQNPAFLKRAANATTAQAKARFEFYGNSSLLCGSDGLPHLVVDGDLSHAGEFLIPSLLFLYIAGWIGWVGRAYLIAVRSGSNPEEKEIIIDVPLATSIAFKSWDWPGKAAQELINGKLLEKDENIPVSRR